MAANDTTPYEYVPTKEDLESGFAKHFGVPYTGSLTEGSPAEWIRTLPRAAGYRVMREAKKAWEAGLAKREETALGEAQSGLYRRLVAAGFPQSVLRAMDDAERQASARWRFVDHGDEWTREKRIQVALQFLQAAMEPDRAELLDAAVSLDGLRLDCTPSSVKKDMGKRKHAPPFMSEAFLYPLLGKEDARTVLAIWSRLLRAAGIDPDDVARRAEEDYRARLSPKARAEYEAECAR